MKVIKVSEATELQLDWLVARIEGVVGDDGLPKLFRWTGSGRLSVRSEPRSDSGLYDPSTNWARGGPIIERENISVGYQGHLGVPLDSLWFATNRVDACGFGQTPLSAVMRSFVASRLGEEVEAPDELA